MEHPQPHLLRPPLLLKKILFDRLGQRFLIVALSLFGCLLGLLGPFFQQIFIDLLISENVNYPLPSFVSFLPIENLTPVALLFGAFFAALSSQGLTFLSSFIGLKESLHCQHHLSALAYRKMLNLRAEDLKSRTTGDMVALYATDVQSATVFLDQVIPNGASALFPIILSPIALHYAYGLPLWDLFIAISFVFLLSTFFARRQSIFFVKYKELAAERIGVVNEWIQNIRTLRILGWTKPFEGKIREKREKEVQNRVAMVTNGQTMNAMSSSATFFINLFALYLLVRSKPKVTPGELLSLLWILAVFLNRPFRSVPWFFTMSFDGWTSVKRVCAFLNLEHSRTFGSEESKPPQSSLNPSLKSPVLEVKNLNLSIGSKDILKNVDLTIYSHEFVAIVGEVGSGKSLLLLSLLGETSATFDQYRIFGEEMGEASQKNLCSFFSFVPQEGFLMSATLRENVAFNYNESQDHDDLLLSSLVDAHFNPQEESLPLGLSTEIGERGVNLSGGQKQRVSLARASYYDRPFILLDDSLSAVDVRTEQWIIKNLLRGKWSERARILVTHRLSVLKEVDRIFFLDSGRLVDQGTLEELLDRCDLFCTFLESLKNEEEAETTSTPQESVGMRHDEI